MLLSRNQLRPPIFLFTLLRSKNFRLFAIFILLISLFPHNSQAALFKITNRSISNNTYLSQANSLFDLLETEINKKLPDADQSSYLKGMANSGVMATKGLGTDYATEPDIFTVGGGVGVGADLGSNTFSNITGGDVKASEIRGFGAQASAVLGLNLGVLPWWNNDFLKRSVLSINFMSMDVPSVAEDLNGEISSFGMHLKYKLYDGADYLAGTFKWGGVFLSGGFDSASMKLNFKKHFAQSKSLTDSGVTFDLSYTGDATVGADVSILTIPLEISSYVRILYFLSTYAGLGTDINFGSAKSIAKVEGNITGSYVQAGGGSLSGTGVLDLGSEGKPNFINGRAFLGLQFNLTILKLITQFNKGIGVDTWGAYVGARIAW